MKNSYSEDEIRHHKLGEKRSARKSLVRALKRDLDVKDDLDPLQPRDKAAKCVCERGGGKTAVGRLAASC